jgi:hypothetical protein
MGKYMPTASSAPARVREQNSDPLLHFTEISVLIEQYDNKLGVEFRTEVIGHVDVLRKHPVRAAGGSGHAASLAALGFQFQGRS